MTPFRINRVYTRSGDRGQTGLVGGDRVSKSHPRLMLVGDVDELNSYIGLIVEKLDSTTNDLRPFFIYIQQELFDLGSEIVTPVTSHYIGMWQVSSSHVEYLEQLCDRFGEGLPELTSFILPGGSELAALIHLARAVARRAERSLVVLQEMNTIDDHLFLPLQYLNRLSDLLFILARWVLKAQGLAEVTWTKEKRRIEL